MLDLNEKNSALVLLVHTVDDYIKMYYIKQEMHRIFLRSRTNSKWLTHA